MNYAEFNGLGLLGQPILCINENEENGGGPPITYDELMETRNELSASLDEFIENKKQTKEDNGINDAIAAFKLFYEENVRGEQYEQLVQLDHRINTLDRAIVILHNEYNRRHSILLESVQIPKKYPDVLEDYLYLKKMNEFIERTNAQFKSLPRTFHSDDQTSVCCADVAQGN
jgi:hypothetical protein